MALHESYDHTHHHGRKTLAEGAVCFSCAIAALVAAAIAIQWAMGFVI